ncbi:aldehyde dehydrogenase family protein [Sphingobium sp. Sx8-8]|uniref:aldehyde dehydrogenase family protein n=1 Tax=Sphingobium sp. Sx8-8 TaxID=2933617 RepID=UPI001F576C76|nr:aldehyde dehydrogenase family protein [Sphingobium sp. Sx8-8]
MVLVGPQCDPVAPLHALLSFTGSTAAGKAVARACIERMARFTLELGGKSAAILLDDVRLDKALLALAPFTMPMSGQICFAQTRILAPRSRVDEVAHAYSAVMAGLTVGDPWQETTHLGPVANARQLGRVTDYVEIAKAEGARLTTGGARPAERNKGFFFEPTVFVDVTPDMRIAREEVFGPVVAVMAYDDIDDAVRIANATDFGLSGSVFTEDVERGGAVARRINTGNMTVNGLEVVPNVPFGGTKMSGIGREGGPEGLEAFLESKAVYMPAAG